MISVVVWLHVLLGRDTTNLFRGMALMNLLNTWARALNDLTASVPYSSILDCKFIVF